jgi:hypothetical protein
MTSFGAQIDLDEAYWLKREPDVLEWFRDLLEDNADDDHDVLWGSEYIVNMDVVYRITAPAIRCLGRFLEAGRHVPELIDLISYIAGATRDVGHRRGKSAKAAHAAALAQLPVILRFATEGEVTERNAAVAALPLFGAPELVLAVLRCRWVEEVDPGVRATVLNSLRLLVRDEATLLAEAALDDAADAVRALAVAVVVEAGASWTGTLKDALIGAYPGYRATKTASADPFDMVVRRLRKRGAWADACDLVEVQLLRAVRDNDANARVDAFTHLGDLCNRFRSAPERLLSVITELLSLRVPQSDSFSETTQRAAELLEDLGDIAAPAADALVSLAGDPAMAEAADHALAALVRLDDPRAADLLARHLPDRPGALQAAAQHGLPFTPVLLDVIRWRLQGKPLDRDARFEQMLGDLQMLSDLRRGHIGHDEDGDLFKLLAAWGPEAAAALPELQAVHSLRRPEATAALVAVAQSTEHRPQVEAFLRDALANGEPWHRLDDARALWHLTGDASPVLAEIETAFTRHKKHRRDAAAEICVGLGEEARPLLPLLLEALADGRVHHDWQVDVAVTVWRLTGDADLVLPALASAFDRGMATDKALALVIEMGPAASSLGIRLIRPLEHPYPTDLRLPSVALALLRTAPNGLLPGGLTTRSLAKRLLAVVETRPESMAVWAALKEIRIEELSPKTRGRLQKMAYGERRCCHSILPAVATDEHLRRAARELLET